MKILIIEDDIPIRDTLQYLLELNGHTVLTATAGPAALRLVAERPDLIFSDVGLPGMDGFEVMSAVRQLPGGGDIPFIFLTARTDRADQRRGMALGADDYITKPFTERDILDAIAACTRRQQPLRERVANLLGAHQREVRANWSHELMTPLNGVLGGLELIEAEADTIKPDELRELLKLVRAGAERQQVLAQKLVLYYELEREKAAPRAHSCAVSEVMQAAADRQRRPADELAVTSEPAMVRSLDRYLGAAVTELIDNALHFSRPGAPVAVTGFCQGMLYVIEVADQGFGLTADQCARIGPFVQFGRDKHEQQGLGLGLAIARAVAEIAGGRLELLPGEAGRGLRARLELPVA